MILPSGVVVKPLTKYSDERGYLTELFRKDELEGFDIQQGYFSITNPGIRRGPHQHEFQSDYFCFLNGSFLLELWDARYVSVTDPNKEVHLNFNEENYWYIEEKMLETYYCVEVGENNPCLVIVPPGVIHSYTNIGYTTAFTLNFPDKLYAGQNKKDTVDEIRYESNILFKEK